MIEENSFLDEYSVKRLFEEGEEADVIFKLASFEKGRYK